MDPVESTEAPYESSMNEGLTGSNAPSSTEAQAPNVESETGPKEESAPAAKELTPVAEEGSNSAGRTTGQKEKDAEAKELFGRMKNAYANEFGKPEYNNMGKKPQAKFWRARQGLGEEDKNEFINRVVEEERNTLLGKMSGNNVSASGDPMATLLKALETAMKAAKELGKTRRRNSPKMMSEEPTEPAWMNSGNNFYNAANKSKMTSRNSYGAANTGYGAANTGYGAANNTGSMNSFMRTPRASSYGNSGSNSNYGKTISRKSKMNNGNRRRTNKNKFESPELAF
jgi:hypothetical protein